MHQQECYCRWSASLKWVCQREELAETYRVRNVGCNFHWATLYIFLKKSSKKNPPPAAKIDSFYTMIKLPKMCKNNFIRAGRGGGCPPPPWWWSNCVINPALWPPPDRKRLAWKWELSDQIIYCTRLYWLFDTTKKSTDTRSTKTKWLPRITAF